MQENDKEGRQRKEREYEAHLVYYTDTGATVKEVKIR